MTRIGTTPCAAGTRISREHTPADGIFRPSVGKATLGAIVRSRETGAPQAADRVPTS